MNRRTLVLAIVAIGAALVLAACSSGGSSGDAGGSTATTTAGSGSGAATSESSSIAQGIQQGLKDMGYYDGAIDGIYGPQTTDAIKAFQKEAGITVDGRWGPETHAVMDAAAGSDSARDAIREIQVQLRSLGFYDGEIDGLYGEATTIGITKAQEACGIELDGVYGPETQACLIELNS